MGATVDGSGVVEITPESLPDGYAYLDTVPYGVISPNASSIALMDGSGGIGYADEAQDQVLQVTFVLGQPSWLEATGAVMYEHEALEVRGQPAVGGRVSPEVVGATLSWLEPDGTFVQLTGYGLELDELTAIAETLEPLSPEAWQALLDQSDAERSRANGEVTSGTEVAPATTTFEGQGAPIDPSSGLPVLIFAPSETDPGAATLSVADEPGVTLTVEAVEMPTILIGRYDERYVYGVVPADTERLEVSGAGFAYESTSFQLIEGGGTFPAWAFIVEVPDQRGITFTAHLEDGSTVVTQT
jgi:hypothetical protein